MDETTDQVESPQLDEMTVKLRTSYKKLSFFEKREAKKAFAKKFKISKDTVRHKLSGQNTTSLTEATWMEQYVEKKLSEKSSPVSTGEL
jgi:hypothetical protein